MKRSWTTAPGVNHLLSSSSLAVDAVSRYFGAAIKKILTMSGQHVRDHSPGEGRPSTVMLRGKVMLENRQLPGEKRNLYRFRSSTHLKAATKEATSAGPMTVDKAPTRLGAINIPSFISPRKTWSRSLASPAAMSR